MAQDIHEWTSQWTLKEISLIPLIFSLTINTYKNHGVSPACNYSHENVKKNSYSSVSWETWSHGADACCKNWQNIMEHFD